MEKCLQNLEPDMEDILDAQTRFVWIANVQEVKLTVSQLLSLSNSYESEFSRKAQEIIKKARYGYAQTFLQ